MFNFLKPKITVATHNGSFHADDVFACATLSIWAEKEGKIIKIIRTRDPEIIDKADIVVDVGNTYDQQKNRFDHHQKGGAGAHENGVPYASFGLVWKHYGEKICSKEIVEMIEKRLVMPIDARDNGVNIYNVNSLGIYEYTIGDAVHTMRKGLVEEEEIRRVFNNVLYFAKKILEAEIELARSIIEGNDKTELAIKSQDEPEILIMDEYTQWEKTVTKYKNVKFVIYPDRNQEDWCVQVGRNDLENYDSNRINFPASWRGLRDDRLIQASGISDAIFCHNGGFFAVAKTKEAALEMAQKALGML